MAPPLLIHPGFHKTGTTWLQRRVFGDSPCFANLFTHDEVDEIFVRPGDFAFSADRAARLIAQRRDHAPGRTAVISSEILSGEIFTGSLRSGELARRLAEATGGQAKILLTVRSQHAWARAFYIQYVKRGGRMPPDRYFTHRPEPGFAWFRLDQLQFGQLADFYASQFGPQNVLVLPQEWLLQDRTAWLAALAGFAGLEPGALAQCGADNQRDGWSPPVSGLWLTRVSNLFRQVPLNPGAVTAFAGVGHALHALAYRWKFAEGTARARLDRAIAEHVPAVFAESNGALQRFCPVDLAPLGYQLADQAGRFNPGT